MRTLKDRIRHALLFEGIALLIIIPVTAWIMDSSLGHTGALGVLLSLLAMLWNGVYNYGFELLELRWGSHPSTRTHTIRLLHTIGFDLGFLLVSVPLAAWWLAISLWQALMLDLGFLVFFIVYTYFFNLLYDRLFPAPARPLTRLSAP